MPKRFNTGNVDLMICLAADCGGETIGVNEAQAAEYQRDPDGFAARYYGMTLEQYYEWLEAAVEGGAS
jgi:hypothetical protein